MKTYVTEKSLRLRLVKGSICPFKKSQGNTDTWFLNSMNIKVVEDDKFLLPIVEMKFYPIIPHVSLNEYECNFGRHQSLLYSKILDYITIISKLHSLRVRSRSPTTDLIWDFFIVVLHSG